MPRTTLMNRKISLVVSYDHLCCHNIVKVAESKLRIHEAIADLIYSYCKMELFDVTVECTSTPRESSLCR